MSTSADIRDIWLEKVWRNAAVLAITEKIYSHSVIEGTAYDILKLTYQKRINFITYTVQKDSEPLIGGLMRYKYTVTVSYHLQASDQENGTFEDVEDALDAIDSVVIQSLGPTWQHKVDYYEGAEAQGVDDVEIDERQCWVGSLVYTAYRTV